MAYRSVAVRCVAPALLFACLHTTAFAAPRTLGVVAIDLPQGVLSPITASIMTREAERIWSAAGVHLEWRPGADAPASDGIAVHLLSSGAPWRDGYSDYVMGDAQQITRNVRVSIAAAIRIVHQSKAQTAGRPANVDDMTLGFVLGRVLAHEIGHQLIGPGHTARGLMRAVFRSSDLVDPRPGLFEAGSGDVARIAARLASGQLSGLLSPVTIRADN